MESRAQGGLASDGRKNTYSTVTGGKEKMGANRSRSVDTVSGIVGIPVWFLVAQEARSSAENEATEGRGVRGLRVEKV